LKQYLPFYLCTTDAFSRAGFGRLLTVTLKAPKGSITLSIGFVGDHKGTSIGLAAGEVATGAAAA